MERIDVDIIETIPVKGCKYCLVGFPDVGLVGTIALSYTIHEEQMAEAGYLESDGFPPMVVVHNGDPKSPLRLYSKGDVIALISEIPIDSHMIPHVARSIANWAKSKNVELLITLSGIAVQNRLEIDVPAVYGISSTSSAKEILKKMGVEVLEEGFIVGLHAFLMKECLKENIPNICLLAQSHLRYPDPGAAASLIESLNVLMGWKVNTEKLLAQEDEIRMTMRELMQRTQQQMAKVQKGKEQEIPPMYA